MSTSPQNNDSQEIDLSQIFKKIGRFFSEIPTAIFNVILFVQKRLILFIALAVVGFALGYFLDKNSKVYKSEIIVSPNFGSVDYLYAKISLLESKLNEKDTIFFKSIGIKNPKSIAGIDIEPIVDIYNFVASNTTNVNNAQNTQNFELIKLLSEDGDVNEVITSKVTSKNYARHSIIVTTKAKISNKDIVNPLLIYLNKNEYYQNLQKTHINNVKAKMIQDEAIIDEIDVLLNQFSLTTANSQKNDKLIYYNENSQLNEIIKTKNSLVEDIGGLKVNLITYEKVIVKNSSVLNVQNKKGLNSKMKFVIPLFLIVLYLVLYLFIAFYKNQAVKLSTSKVL